MIQFFKQVVINEFGNLDTIEIRQTEKLPPANGQVQVNIKCAPINVSDLLLIKGQFYTTELPTPLGIEGSGIIVSSGGGDLADSLVGKRVALAAGIGTYGQFVNVEATKVFPIQDNITFQQAASMVVNPMTVAIMIDHIKSGNHKAVFINAAASALGKMLIRWCLLIGVAPICLVRRDEQREILIGLGAQYIFVTSQEGWQEGAKKLSSELKATIGFDAIGGRDGGDMLKLLQPRGIQFNYGSLSGDLNVSLVVSDMLVNEKVYRGFNIFSSLSQWSEEKIGAMVLEVQELLGSVLKTDYVEEIQLDEIRRAVEIYERNKTNTKFLIRVSN